MAQRQEKIRPVKSLGQNFLIDEDVIADIVDGAEVGPTDLVIEIGPGTGALTRGLAREAGLLVGVEIDGKLIPVLERALARYPNTEIIQEDFLKCDAKALVEERLAAHPDLTGVQIVGNLPYYITTPIIMSVLEGDVPFTAMTVMMQKEVGQRILARPGTKEYGALSVAVQYYCRVQKITDVSRHSFRPVPKVDSVVLRLVKRDEPAIEALDTKMFFTCVKTAFSKRRKTLLNCFTGLLGLDKEETEAVLREAGIDPGLRGEVLTIEDFGRLADTYARRQEAAGTDD